MARRNVEPEVEVKDEDVAPESAPMDVEPEVEVKDGVTKYTVISRLQHNGKVLEKGDNIKLGGAFAAPLLTAGVIELA